MGIYRFLSPADFPGDTPVLEENAGKLKLPPAVCTS
jgi:hypothetical protein